MSLTIDLKEIDEELYTEAWENNWGSIDAWDFFETRLIEGIKMTG